ncbi:MAG: hypothetical protein ACK513_07840 [Aphanizomenon sp.]
MSRYLADDWLWLILPIALRVRQSLMGETPKTALTHEPPITN